MRILYNGQCCEVVVGCTLEDLLNQKQGKEDTDPDTISLVLLNDKVVYQNLSSFVLKENDEISIFTLSIGG